MEALTATAAGHFRLNYHAAALRLLEGLRAVGSVVPSDRYAFLEAYRDGIQPTLPDAEKPLSARSLERELVLWEATGPRDLPLRALTERMGLGLTQRLMWMAAGMGEEDSRFGALFAFLQGGRSRRPTVEILSRLIARDADGDAWSLIQPLIESGLLTPEEPHAPRAEQPLRVPPILWDVARGHHGLVLPAWARTTSADEAPTIDALVLPTALVDRLAKLPPILESGEAGALVLRGSPGAETERIAAAVARRMERGVLALDGRAITGPSGAAALVGPLAVLLDAIPALTFDLTPGETVELPALRGHQGPLFVLLRREGGLRGPQVERAVTVVVPPPLESEREQLWRAALTDVPVEGLSEIARAFHLPSGYIRQAAELARVDARLEPGGAVRASHVRSACRFLNRQLLDALATRVDTEGGWDDLVVGPSTQAKLHELERRCRHRERLLDHLGPAFGQSTTRGVRGLFAGASGTGKTLAARILASVLGMDLYRVDLAAVVNKYIGETEKNLHRVLSIAEELDVVLLLDEGDALMAGRTEVRSSNDRYANLETNYLLQRLESYDGIVLVTTNVGDNIDQAFRRRMDVMVSFVRPGPLERLHIWQLHLPREHQVSSEQLNSLASRCALTGGQIRNAAQHATLLALDAGGVPVDREHLEEAIKSEYRKAGATWPLEARPDQGEQRVARFVEGFGR